MNVKKLLQQHQDIESALYNYFGFEERWHVIPLSDDTDMYWFLTSGKVVYSEDQITKESVEVGNICSAETDEDSIFRKDDFTMVIGDTNTDGNVFLMIFDNKLEVKDEEIIDTYNEHW